MPNLTRSVLTLLFVPLLGSLTEGYPHATRTLIWQPFLQIVAAGGMLALGAFVRCRGPASTWNVVRGTALLLIALLLAQLIWIYTGSYRQRSATQWWDGLVPALRVAALHIAVDDDAGKAGFIGLGLLTAFLVAPVLAHGLSLSLASSLRERWRGQANGDSGGE